MTATPDYATRFARTARAVRAHDAIAHEVAALAPEPSDPPEPRLDVAARLRRREAAVVATGVGGPCSGCGLFGVYATKVTLPVNPDRYGPPGTEAREGVLRWAARRGWPTEERGFCSSCALLWTSATSTGVSVEVYIAATVLGDGAPSRHHARAVGADYEWNRGFQFTPARAPMWSDLHGVEAQANKHPFEHVDRAKLAEALAVCKATHEAQVCSTVAYPDDAPGAGTSRGGCATCSANRVEKPTFGDAWGPLTYDSRTARYFVRCHVCSAADETARLHDGRDGVRPTAVSVALSRFLSRPHALSDVTRCGIRPFLDTPTAVAGEPWSFLSEKDVQELAAWLDDCAAARVEAAPPAPPLLGGAR